LGLFISFHYHAVYREIELQFNSIQAPVRRGETMDNWLEHVSVALHTCLTVEHRKSCETADGLSFSTCPNCPCGDLTIALSFRHSPLNMEVPFPAL
jgi:hypothetical protein